MNLSGQAINRILVIKLRHLGDVLLTAPVFHVLKKKFPNAIIDAYIYRESKPMLEGHPAISDFILSDRAWKKLPLLRRLKEEGSLLREIRSRGYDLVINLTEGDRGALAALASGASWKVGFDPGRAGFLGKRKIFTHLVKNCPTPRHAVERNLDALRCMGIFPMQDERKLDFVIPQAAERRVQQILDAKGLGQGEFVVIHPVSRWFFKCLPPERTALLIRALRERGQRVVVTAGADAKELAYVKEVLEICSDDSVISLAGQLSLKELGAVFLKARALFTVDSVSLHIASALKVPVVAFFGPTSEKNWGPWQHPRARVVAEKLPCRPCFQDGCGGGKRSDCLDTLSIETILRAYDEVCGFAAVSALFALNPFAANTTE